MKMKFLAIGVFMLLAKFSFAQNFEVKVNPIGLIFGTIPVSAEYVLNENMGVELTAEYNYNKGSYFDGTTKASGIVVAGLYKYYFKPHDGGDGFYAFPYLRYANRKFTFDDTTYGEVTATYTAFGAGFGLGYKWVAESGLLIDFGAGVGKNFNGSFSYSDPNYSSTDDVTIPINGIFRISLGYRF